ncbi:MAG: hypothetical protein ACSHYA_00015 [Opitutaceae bacterium]
MGTIEPSLDSNGFPFLDEFGNPELALPVNYKPSLIATSAGLTVLTIDYSMYSDPPIIDSSGFPIFGNYFQLSTATYQSNVWTVESSITELVENLEAPSLVSRYDDQISVSHFEENLLYIDTIASPANERLTLPVVKSQAAVCIDQNEGVHVLSINANYELWHNYYSDTQLFETKLSDGPVCFVKAEAGQGDECHVVYSTFSEDANFNDTLEDGEDLNGNSVLDDLPNQLLYQSIDGVVASTLEIIADEAILRLCNFDLHYSQGDGLKVAFADPVQNSVRLASSSLSSWSSEQISTVAGMYQSVALDVSSVGDIAVSYISEDHQSLYVSELVDGSWSESLVAESTVGGFFRGTDIAYDQANDIALLTSERATNYLNLYTRSSLTSLLDTLVRPIEIRGAFIITWPTPSEAATTQILQSNSDLSDPDGWQFVEQRTVSGTTSETAETTVEQEASQQFYRIVEMSD